MANVYKLVFAGPVGAGKTTAIQSLSDIEVVRTEANATDEVRLLLLHCRTTRRLRPMPVHLI